MSTHPADCGTPAGYRRGCRCRPCTDAHAQRIADQKARRLARAAEDPSLIPHGTQSGYINWNCRCPKCVEANRTKRNPRRKADNAYRPWTAAERAVAMQNRPVREIAAELGRSYYAVLTVRYLDRQRRAAAGDAPSTTSRSTASPSTTSASVPATATV